MEFRPIGLGDAPLIRRLFSEDPPSVADLSFSYEFAHSRTGCNAARFAQTAGCGIFRWRESGETRFSIPFGRGDVRLALAELAVHCRERALSFVLMDVPEPFARSFRDLLPGEYSIEEDRDEFDYVYCREDLANLVGRHYQDRRRMIHRFEDGGPWAYEQISDANIDVCREILAEWLRYKLADSPAASDHLDDDISALRAVFDNYGALGMVGGVLRQRGRPVAFAMGEPLNDRTMLVAFERALPSVRGASAMINREFVRRHCDGFELVNRTCDGGDEGLRKVKLEYRPVRFERKFLIRGVPRLQP